MQPEEVYQKCVKGEITMEQAVAILWELNFSKINRNSQREIYKVVKKLGIDSHYTPNYLNKGVNKEQAKVLGLLESLGIPFEQVSPEEFCFDQWNFYSINEKGYITKLLINCYDRTKLWFIPEEICLLSYLEILCIAWGMIMELPKCLKYLKELKEISLLFNNIINLDDLIIMSEPFYLDNILEYVDLNEFNEEITLDKIDELMAEKLRVLEEAKIEPWNFEIGEIQFPPKEVIESNNSRYIILWMLDNNKVCTWEDLRAIIDPVTLIHYLDDLVRYRYIEEIKNEDLLKQFYRLTPWGAEEIREIE